MVHGKWIQVVWAISCRCEFPPRLVVGLAVTQETESVCLGRLKRAVIHYMIKRSLCVFSGKCYKIPICLCSCPEMYIILY